MHSSIKKKHFANGQKLEDFCLAVENMEDPDAILTSMREADLELSLVEADYMDKSAAEQLGIHLCENQNLFEQAMTPNWAPLLRKPSAANWGGHLSKQALSTPNPADWLESLAARGLVFFSPNDTRPASDWHGLAQAPDASPIDWMIKQALKELGKDSKAFALQSQGAIAQAIEHGNEHLWKWASEACEKTMPTHATFEAMASCLHNGKPQALALLKKMAKVSEKPTSHESKRLASFACRAPEPMDAINALGKTVDWKEILEENKFDPIALICMRGQLNDSAIMAIKKLKTQGFDPRCSTDESASTAAIAATYLTFEQTQTVFGLNGSDLLAKCARSHYQGEGRLDAISFALDHSKPDSQTTNGDEQRLAVFLEAALEALANKPEEEIKENLINWAGRCAREGLPELFWLIGQQYQKASSACLPSHVFESAACSTPMGEATEHGRRLCFAKAKMLGMDLNESWDNKWSGKTCIAKRTIEGLMDCLDDKDYRNRLGLRLLALAELGAEISPHCPGARKKLPSEIEHAMALEEAATLRNAIAKNFQNSKTTRKASI